MEEINKTNLAENPPEERDSHFEENFTCAMHTSQEPHENNPMHAS